jgi:hypothetical protein
MPTPGSKAFDVDRARLRKDLENSGLNDQKANEAAKAELRGRDSGRDPAKDTDRARGPKSERPGANS